MTGIGNLRGLSTTHHVFSSLQGSAAVGSRATLAAKICAHTRWKWIGPKGTLAYPEAACTEVKVEREKRREGEGKGEREKIGQGEGQRIAQ